MPDRTRTGVAKTGAKATNDDIKLDGIEQEEIYSLFAESEGDGHWLLFYYLVARDDNSPLVVEKDAMAKA